jgi:hypothetical protein
MVQYVYMAKKYGKGLKWNEITWYSKLGAIVLFLAIVPVLSFYIGTVYQQVIDLLAK